MLAVGVYLAYGHILPFLEKQSFNAKTTLKNFYLYYYPYTVGRFVVLALLFYLGVSLAWSFTYGPALAASAGLPLWFYDLFILKTAGITSAHTTTYLTIFAVYILTWLLTDSEYFSFLTAGAYAAIHELIWFVPYFAFYWNTLPFDQHVADLGFCAGLLAALYFWVKKTWAQPRLRFLFIATLMVCTWFDVMWVVAGFHITVNGALPTQWVNDVTTSLLEDFSWYAPFVVFFGLLLKFRGDVRLFKLKYGFKRWRN